MENLKIYRQIEDVPAEAQKKITGGRLNGMTDIKPMWRIEKLTELFGPCGIGWYTKTTKKEIIDGANGEKIAVVDILLFICVDGSWSEGIEGSGGSSFIANEKNGLYTSDECFKMAYTDALSVACKSLGMGAKVYWGDSKYNQKSEPTKEDAEKYTLTFGKYKQMTLKEVIEDEEDEDYIDWLLKNSKDNYLLKCIELLTGVIPPTEEEMNKQLELTLKLQELIVSKNVDLEKMLEYYEVDKIDKLTQEQLKDLIRKLEKRPTVNILDKAEKELEEENNGKK